MLTANIKRQLERIDWKLLIFLVLLMNVKLAVKLVALVLIYIGRFDFSPVKNLFNKPFLGFYLLMTLLCTIECFIHFSFTDLHYLPVWLTACFFWIFSMLVLNQLFLFIERNTAQKLLNTLICFFVMNAAVSIGQLIFIMIDCGSFNPYRFQGFNQKYFMGTGDLIKGFSFDQSATNAVINATGVIFFLQKRNILLSFLCMTCMLMTGSNLTNIIVASIFVFLLFLYKSNQMRSFILGLFIIMTSFILKISPENNKYIGQTIKGLAGTRIENELLVFHRPIEQTPDSLLSIQDRKIKFYKIHLDSLRKTDGAGYPRVQEPSEKGKALNPLDLRIALLVAPPDINSAPYQLSSDSSGRQKNLMQQAHLVYHDSDIFQKIPLYEKYPGKLISFCETYRYLATGGNFLMGAGPGNYSSRLAFRASGLQTPSGSWPKGFEYASDQFKNDHLKIFIYYFIREAGRHSVLNLPNSAYNQLLGEYGIAGLTLFIIFYLGFFIRNYKRITPAIPLLFLLCAVLAFDYWFEQLSVIILLEFLLMIQVKDKINVPIYA